jgi:endonuclease-3
MMRRFTKRQVAEFYRRLAATRPIPQTELEFINPFTLLVAVVLSAQATDVGVNKATPALFAIADTPAKMLALGEERVAEMIRTIGLYRTKARNVVATIAVDTHIFRVGNRTGLAPGRTPIEVEAGLEKATPAEYKLGAHHWLILHGRYVCKARKPDCPVCVVADLCRYGAKTAPSEMPAELIRARAEAAAPAPPAEPEPTRPRARRR